MDPPRFAMNALALAGDLEAKLDAGFPGEGLHSAAIVELIARAAAAGMAAITPSRYSMTTAVAALRLSSWNARASRLNGSALGLRSQHLTPYG